MAGLSILKHTHNLSDEELCVRGVENPHFQLFCGEEFFRHRPPSDRSSLTRWCQRTGKEKLVALIPESLGAATRTGAAKPSDFSKVILGSSHGCPIRGMLAWAHGFDFTRLLSFATHRDHERAKTVRHRNSSVFRDILKLVPWTAFDGLVVLHGADEGTRSFTSRQHLTALLFAQLSGACSLREIEAAMASHQGRLYHCGAVAPKRSTVADANRNRDFRVFSGLFDVMLAQAGRGLRRKIAHAVRLIDSTGLRLAGVGAEWARYSTSVFGVKAHVVYDPDHGGPVYHALTASNVNDITAAKEMPIEASGTYVFDLGYLRLRLLDGPRQARLPAGDALQGQYALERAARNAARTRNDRAQ